MIRLRPGHRVFGDSNGTRALLVLSIINSLTNQRVRPPSADERGRQIQLICNGRADLYHRSNSTRIEDDLPCSTVGKASAWEVGHCASKFIDGK